MTKRLSEGSKASSEQQWICPQDLQVLFSLTLKNRIIREHRRRTVAEAQPEEMELLLMELIDAHAGRIFESSIIRVFGMQTASARNLTKKMIRRGFLLKSDGKNTPLKLSDAGKQTLDRYKKGAAASIRYMFSKIRDQRDKEAIHRILPLLEEAATEQLLEDVVGIPRGL